MALMIPRTNHALAAIVDKGIVIAGQFGLTYGSLYMRHNGVPMDVALRVLTRPRERRTYL